VHEATLSTAAPAASARGHGRLPLLDVLRGAAIAQMVAYHFCYDLNYFSWIRVALTQDAGWIAWRTVIVSQFLFVAGVALALRPGAAAGVGLLRTRGFWRRWLQVATGAALVSAGSAALFGPRFIWFGVLHFNAVAVLLLAPLLPLGRRCALAGALVIAAGLAVTFAPFSSNALSWIGFSPVKPQTEDFVPLLPWAGVVLLGMAAGSAWRSSSADWANAARRFRGRGLGVLALAGRWPLTVYLLHQPLLFGALKLLAATRG